LKEAKTLLGKQVLGDTRADTKRRQAAVNATKALQEVTKPTSTRKTNLKRLGTMGNTARVSISSIIIISLSIHSFIFKEGKAYIQRTTGAKKTTGRNRRGGRVKNDKK